MSAPKTYSIQRIWDVTFKNVAATTLYGTTTAVKEMSIENAQENVYSMGGVGNPYLSSFSHSKRVTGTASVATYQEEILELVTGTDVSTGAVTIPLPFEDVEINSDAAATTYTAIGDVGSEILKIEIMGAGGVTAVLSQAVAASATEFTYTVGTKALAFNADDYDDGTIARVYYDITTGSDAITVSNKSNEFSKIVRLEMKSLVQDCEGNEYPAVLIIYKVKMTGNYSLDTAADGDPAVLDISFEAMKKNCSDTKFWDLVVYDDSEVS